MRKRSLHQQSSSPPPGGSREGLSTLIEALDCAVQRTAQGEGTTSTFGKIASHLSQFNLTSAAAGVNALCTSFLRTRIRDMKPEEAISPALTCASCVVLDQLFNFLLHCDSSLEDVCTVTRTLLHRSLFPGEADSRSYPAALAEDAFVLEDSFRDFEVLTPFYVATVKLGNKLAASEQRMAGAERGLQLHKRSTVSLQVAQTKRVLQKALLGWRMEVRHATAMRKVLSTCEEVSQKLKTREADYVKHYVHDTHKIEAVTRQKDLLEADLSATRRSFDSATQVADRYRRENEELRATVLQAQEEELAELRRQLDEFSNRTECLRQKCFEDSFSDVNSGFEVYSRELLATVSPQLLTFFSTGQGGELKTRAEIARFLADWAYSMARPFRSTLGTRNNPIFGDRGILTDSLNNAGASVSLLLHRLSPGHVSFHQVTKTFKLDPVAQVAQAQNVLSIVGLGEDVAEQLVGLHQVEDTPKQERMVIDVLFRIFERFAGGCPTQVPFRPPQTAEDTELWSQLFPNFRARLSCGFSLAMGTASHTLQRPMEDVLGEIAAQNQPRKAALLTWATLARRIRMESQAVELAELQEQLVAMVQTEKMPPIPTSEKKKAALFRFLPSALLDHQELKYDASLRQEVEAVLSMFCPHIRRTFMYYSKKGRLAMEDFLQCISDIGVLQTFISHTAVERVFQQSSGSGLAMSPLNGGQFVEALLRLSFALESSSCGATTALEKVQWLIKGHIGPRSIGSQLILHRRGFALEQVQEVLRQFDDHLRKIYLFYCGAGIVADPLSLAVEDFSFTSKEFLRLCSDAKCTDKDACSPASLQELTLHVPEGTDQDGDQHSTQLQWNDFLVLLTALAAMKSPSPVYSSHAKVRRFIENFLSHLPPKKKE